MGSSDFIRSHTPSRGGLKFSLLIFLVLCLNELGFDLHGNEERYFGLALHFFDPQWVPDNFHFKDFPGTRLLFQWITGPFVKAEGFEFTAFMGRLLSFSAMSIPLGLLFKKLRSGFIEVLAVFQFFLLTDQAFFGGEWLFDGYEAKTIAYIFFFFALYFFSCKRYLYVAFHLLLATYFHFLVGGWGFVALLLFLLMQREYKTLWKAGLLYILPLLPFVLYLYSGYFQDVPDLGGSDPDGVYCYERVPHHLGLFKSMDYFWHFHMMGVLMTAGVFVLGILIYKKLSPEARQLDRLMLLFFGINLLFVGVAYLDRYHLGSSCSMFLKYYPFRTNSPGMLISFILASSLFRDHSCGASWRRFVAIPLLLVLVVIGVKEGGRNIKDSIEYDRNHAFNEICEYVDEHTPKDAQFLLLDISQWSREYMSFIRKSERSNFFVFKFMFGSKERMHEWWKRKELYEKLEEDPGTLEKIRAEYDPDYVLTSASYEGESFKRVYQNKDYKLYELE